ncbi:MAG: class I SAM-dependent methyltransferase [Termitinemataceae bacterium]|nr:MAG: class I SAM-dependent methyltransferase [Termitinemataceae bacterium]
MMSQQAYQAGLLYNRLVKRHRHLQKWAKRCGTGAYRLYDRDIPEIPLVLDFLHNEKQIAVCGSLFERPYYKEESEEKKWLDAMLEAISGSLRVQRENIFIKLRRRQRTEGAADDQYQKASGDAIFMDIAENGLQFRLNLSAYIDNGLFLDLRKARSFIKENAQNKKVLNLFCYTASFSVYAAAGGAAQIDSVDMSNTYLNWGKTNFALNSNFLNIANGSYNFVRADVIRYIDDSIANKQKWDIIILDPPVFSNSKKMQGNALNGVLDIKRDYKNLLIKCLSLLNENGFIFFSVHSRSFKFDVDDFYAQCCLGQTSTASNCNLNYPHIIIKERAEMFRDEDFKGRKIPCCYIISI